MACSDCSVVISSDTSWSFGEIVRGILSPRAASCSFRNMFLYRVRQCRRRPSARSIVIAVLATMAVDFVHTLGNRSADGKTCEEIKTKLDAVYGNSSPSMTTVIDIGSTNSNMIVRLFLMRSAQAAWQTWLLRKSIPLKKSTT
ncbi:PREDICTED: uncharacterized protein LOC105146467 [Acromyrmex echinatior]|uniref:uncharacterized protein LOC105146467 n=1 Tax=Acromyrmex echinatior TaxID=103372 RepID=UPI00058104CF|nr:PREDICTED: uncharacterized protein LOC105146467 [Acromyrmex echinatior]